MKIAALFTFVRLLLLLLQLLLLLYCPHPVLTVPCHCIVMVTLTMLSIVSNDFFCSFVLFDVYVDMFRRLLRRLCPTPKPELAAKKCGGTDFGAFVRQILKPPEESERSDWEGVTLTELLKMCRHPSGKVRTVDECMLLFFWV